jgi:uncharacterized protein (DUF305 family)
VNITSLRKLPGLLGLLVLTAGIATACGSSKKTVSANATDKAFVQQMIPHHQMAVQMANSAKQKGQHNQITTLANGIVSAQDTEIAEMTPIAKQLGVTPDHTPIGDGMGGMGGGHVDTDAKALKLSMAQMGMSMDMSSFNNAQPCDRAFIDMMIPHHQGAVRMARAELAAGKNRRLRAIAKRIVAAQANEITQLNSWRSSWYGAASPAGASLPPDPNVLTAAASGLLAAASALRTFE